MANEDILQKIQELKDMALRSNVDLGEEVARLQDRLMGVKIPSSLGDVWRKVELARNPDRPTSLEIISHITEDFMEFHGDRYFGDDPALIGGVGIMSGRAITFIGHQKGRTMKENIRRNYGYAHPEGYRKALRLAQQAEKFGRPIVTFIDTAGAYPGLASEERGIGEAIAKNLRDLSVLKVPIICFIIGEGGSGGALGIGIGNEIYMLENTTYSVISPEGFASILLRDSTKNKEAAAQMKMTAVDLLSFGIIDGIIPEPVGGAHLDKSMTAANIKHQILDFLQRVSTKTGEVLVKERFNKLLSLGRFVDESAPKQNFFQKLFSSNKS